MTKLIVALRNFANAPKNDFLCSKQSYTIGGNQTRQLTRYCLLVTPRGSRRPKKHGSRSPKQRPHHALPLYIYWL